MKGRILRVLICLALAAGVIGGGGGLDGEKSPAKPVRAGLARRLRGYGQNGEMPGFCAEAVEKAWYILDYYRTLGPENALPTVSFLGITDMLEPEPYKSAMHYRIYEAGRTLEAFVEKQASSPYYYVRTGELRYEKRQCGKYTADNGTLFCFAFSQGFELSGEQFRNAEEFKVQAFAAGSPLWTDSLDIGLDHIMTGGSIGTEDYNFDGIPDLAIPCSFPANWGGRTTEIYIREENGYHFAGALLSPSLSGSTQTVREFSRAGAGTYCDSAYRYEDGCFVCLGTLQTQYIRTEGSENTETRYTLLDESGAATDYGTELPEEEAKFWFN